ncbi:MAG: aminoglycoside phosphotransferase family protein [Rhodobacteraceae bacterium]|nr:aminoglycoside phosphotransferase family protein [Paracoccaceae bacterium]
MDIQIDASLVKRLIARQFPHLGDLPVGPVAKQGWDNRTFRLGESLTVRLPVGPAYAAAVKKEAVALAALKPHLSVALPDVVALGEPTDDYPLPWSIRRWIEGETLESAGPEDRCAFAKRLGAVLVELRSAPAKMELIAGEHSFFRGCHPSVYGGGVVESLQILAGRVDVERCFEIWQSGITSAWAKEPVWFHGDVAAGNLLMSEGNLCALIDFGTCGVGDPACDFAIAWTYFDAKERHVFREAINVDDGTWSRAKSWALWKALVSLAGLSSPDTNGFQARALREILSER